MFWRVATFLGLASYVLADGPARSEQRLVQHFGPEHQGHHGELAHIGETGPEHHEAYAWSFPSYEFSYIVEDPHTKDYKGQVEKRHGDEVVGEYWLLQPDGRKRTVKYRAEKHKGFQAHVRYEPPYDVHPSPHHKPVVENVEERRPEEHKSAVEVRQRIQHPPPKHDHPVEPKPVHHVHVEHKQIIHKPALPEKPVHVEHKPVYHIREELGPEHRVHIEPKRVVHKPEHHREHIPIEHRPEERRPEKRRPEERRLEERRPEDRGPEERRPEKRRPEERRPEERRPEDRGPEERRLKKQHDGHDKHRPFIVARVPLDKLDPRPIHHHEEPHHIENHNVPIHHHDRPQNLEHWPHHDKHKPGHIIELWEDEARRQEDEYHHIPHVPLYRPHEPYYGHHRRYYTHNEKSKKNE